MKVVIAMPEIEAIPVFPLIPRRRLPFGVAFGQFVSGRRGPGFEYRGSRPMMHGDDIRQLDHKTTMRQSSFKQQFDPWVRERHAEVSLRVMVVVDRSLRMAQYDADLPWLHKPEALVRAGSMIVASAKRMGAFVGYLDFADWAKDKTPFWRPANQETEAAKIIGKYLPHQHFTAPETALNDAFSFLLGLSRDLPQESFVFVLSDFLVMPTSDLLERAAFRWDITPVIIQDPTREASYPVWDEGWLPVPGFLPEDGSSFGIPRSARDARKRKKAHEARLAEICDSFRSFGMVPLTVHHSDYPHLCERFWESVEERKALR